MKDGEVVFVGVLIIAAVVLAAALVGTHSQHPVDCAHAWQEIRPDTALMVDALPTCKPEHWVAP